MLWISNHKHKIEEKSTKSSQSSSKVVGLGPADLWEFPTLGMFSPQPLHSTVLVGNIAWHLVAITGTTVLVLYHLNAILD